MILVTTLQILSKYGDREPYLVIICLNLISHPLPGTIKIIIKIYQHIISKAN